MGCWGPSLYADDFALDLKPSIAAVCRLPFDASKILAILESTTNSSSDQDDEEYTTFWLVVADQLHKRGIKTDAHEKALSIIDDGSNLKVLTELGMEPSDLRKRKKMLETLKERLEQPFPVKARKTLKAPQKFLMEVGDVYRFPVDGKGQAKNPFYSGKEAYYPGFKATGWSGCVITARGRMFDYLAWYQVAPCVEPTRELATLETLLEKAQMSKENAFTLSASHFKRLELELIGSVNISGRKDPSPDKQKAAVISDLDISDRFAEVVPRAFRL